LLSVKPRHSDLQSPHDHEREVFSALLPASCGALFSNNFVDPIYKGQTRLIRWFEVDRSSTYQVASLKQGVSNSIVKSLQKQSLQTGANLSDGFSYCELAYKPRVSFGVESLPKKIYFDFFNADFQVSYFLFF
jgi:hypothetical protein